MMEDPVDKPALPVFRVASVRDIDRAAIDAGIPGYELMTRAAQFAFTVANAEFPDTTPWQILCGSGNNAGDGYVLAKLAMAAGIDAEVLWLSDPGKLAGDAAAAHRDFVAAGGMLRAWRGELDATAGLIVDAMLGSGLSRDVAGPYRDAVAACNAHPAPVVALDLPTGLHGDSGAIMGIATAADVTVTFVGRMSGLYLGAGPDCVGRLYFSDLGIPQECFNASDPDLRIVTAAQIRRQLPRRPRQSHKGDFGHVLVIGGAPGMPGAVRLAGEAALRTGAGRVTVATHAANVTAVPAGCPELMCHAVDGADEVAALLASASVTAIGPGLGRSTWAKALLQAALDGAAPLVVDADALNLLADDPGTRDNCILTPHPGEAARLLGVSAADVQADRRKAVCELQQRYGGTVVLKGCGTLIASGAGAPWLNTSGNPGMSTAGMGDVLTGVIAGLLAQGLPPEMAAVIGVDLHARAADVAATQGERGLLASDLLQELRPWLNP